METIWKDLRFGLRMLMKKPAFTMVAVLALGLGIGANTAIFSVVQTVVLSPLPYQSPERLVWIWESNPTAGIKQESASMPNFDDWRNQNQSFAEMAAFADTALTLTTETEPERLSALVVTDNFFPLLGVEPIVGRSFTAEEHKQGTNRVVILSHALWQRRFGGDPKLVGQAITLNGNPYTVVGVLPPSFKNPVPMEHNTAQLWIPFVLRLDPKLRRSDFLNVVARLKPNVTIEQARTEMKTIAARLEQQYPESNTGWGTLVIPLQERFVGDVRLSMWLLMGVVGFLLLIACANVANLLLARSAARQHEIAIRRALGADRLRLIRQFLTESVLLSLMGGALGTLLAMWGVELLVRLSPGNIPRLAEARLNWQVLLFTLCVSLLTGLVFGLVPAIHATNPDLTESLKEGGRGSTEGLRGARLRNALVISEIAIALILLIGAGLMIKSFMRLQHVDPGFRPERILTTEISLPSTKYQKDPQQLAFWDQFIARVSSLPGVESAAAISDIPLSSGDTLSFTIEGRPDQSPNQVMDAEYRTVTPGYFETMGIALVKGSVFTQQHTSEVGAVAVINEAMARKFWPGEDPVGKRINLGDPQTSPWRTIIGVVKDIRQASLDVEPYPQMYSPLAQFPRRFMTLVVRTSSDPTSFVPSIRKELAMIDKDQPLYNVRTMQDVLAESIARQRFNMMLIAIFAGVGLVLAAVGIYGVISYSVTQRTHEIGVRMALGAQVIDVFRLIVGQGMLLVLIGVCLGLVGAFAVTRLMASLLFNVSATDPLTFVGVALILAVIALLACIIPARKAAKVDPMTALRYE